MKYIKSSGGYYYKELSNGKRTRVSAEEYNTKKQKFQNEQEGGSGKSILEREIMKNEKAAKEKEDQKEANEQKAVENTDELKQLKQKARNLKSEAKKDLEKQNKEKKEQIRQRQGIANELATLILEI